MRRPILIALAALFIARLVFEERIGNKLFAAGFLFILAFPFIAKLLQRITGEQSEKPSLSLVRRVAGKDNVHSLVSLDPRTNEWQVPFALTIENLGKGEAKNWRLWFSPQDSTTSVVLDPTIAGHGAYVKDALTGRCETILDPKSRVLDGQIGPRESVHIGGTSRIVLKGSASNTEIKITLDAEGMPSRSYVWELAMDPENKRVSWNDYIVQDAEDVTG